MESASDLAGTFASNTMLSAKRKDRNWADMEPGVLLKIFSALSVMDLVGSVSVVCSTWNAVCHEPCLWEHVDMTALAPNVNVTGQETQEFGNEVHKNRLMRFLKTALNLSRGKISGLTFNFHIPVSDEHLIHASQKAPELKGLILPPRNALTLAGFEEAIKNWTKLETFTMPVALFEFEVLKLIGAHCKNFYALKVFNPFVMESAKTIVEHIPNLQILSLQGSLVEKEALIYILDNMKNLQVLNLCHCLIADDDLPPPRYAYAARALDVGVLEKTWALKNLLICNADSCDTCQLMFLTEGMSGWTDIDIWRWDNVNVLREFYSI